MTSILFTDHTNKTRITKGYQNSKEVVFLQRKILFSWRTILVVDKEKYDANKESYQKLK